MFFMQARFNGQQIRNDSEQPEVSIGNVIIHRQCLFGEGKDQWKPLKYFFHINRANVEVLSKA